MENIIKNKFELSEIAFELLSNELPQNILKKINILIA